MVSDRMTDLAWVHWCWDSEQQCPCCADEEESRNKTARAAINLFISQGFAVGSLSMFTHTSQCLNKHIAGRVAKRILPRALQFGRVHKELAGFASIRAEELGSGLSDMACTTSTRKAAVAKWLIADQNQYLLPAIKLVTADLDSFEYELFGFDNKGKQTPTGLLPSSPSRG